VSPQKSRAIQPLETPPVRRATEPAGGSTGEQGLALRQDRRFTLRQIQDAVMAVLDTRQVSLWLEHPQNTTTPCGSLHPEDAGHVARWVAETLTDITEEPNV
jgi:hypothetical protein